MYQRLGRKQGIGLCLAGIAGVDEACGHPALAVPLSGATTALLDALGVQLDPIDRANYEHNLIAAQNQLDADQYATAWAEEQTMPLEQAITAALGVLLRPCV
ncbi:MAG TPA: hypothetical protein VFZ66_00620 [Herpetosiphonaceae bacterium]